MHVGTQLGGADLERLGDAYLRQLAQLGVRHVCIDPPGNPHHWTRDSLARHIERIDAADLVLDMVQLPLPSCEISRSQSESILLGKGQERDRDIDSICTLIETLAGLGVKAAKYNLTYLGVPRTAPEKGRGGAVLPAFRQALTTDEDQMTIAGRVDAELFWERVSYFLHRVVPVAEAHQVRLACHPNDPMTRPNYRGIDSILATVEGLKRFVEIIDSPYHGLNFCQGTIAESLENPRAEIDAVIAWFGSRKKIFNVHFRNIKGGRLSFSEVFPDDGDMNMAESFKVYRDVGYDGMIMPDHVPLIDGAAPFETAFAFCFGYIIALFQASGMDPYGR